MITVIIVELLLFLLFLAIPIYAQEISEEPIAPELSTKETVLQYKIKSIEKNGEKILVQFQIMDKDGNDLERSQTTSFEPGTTIEEIKTTIEELALRIYDNADAADATVKALKVYEGLTAVIEKEKTNE